jgi:uncharacterized protein YndB with AHSA1/START domain
MMVLKIFLIVIAVLVTLFIAVGLLVPDFEYENTIVINASPEKCWEIYNDTSTMKSWMEGFRSLELKNGNPQEQGALYEIIIDQGDSMAMAMKIKSITVPQQISWELNNDVLKSEYTYSFRGDEIKTQVDSHYKITGNNVFMKTILFFSRSYLKDGDRQMLESLKKIVESKN